MAVSEVRLARALRWYLDQGASGFMALSEAGEFASCSLSERKQILEWVVRDGGGVSVYVNISAMTTASVVDLAQHGARHGSRGAVLLPPYVGGYSEAELTAHVVAVRRHGNMPALYIDPSEKTQHIQDQLDAAASGQRLTLLSSSILAVAPRPATYEFETPDGRSLGIAVFGQQRAERIANEWERFGPLLQGLFKIAGPARIGKAVLAESGLEIGGHRGPMSGLDSQARQIFDMVWQATS